MRNLFVYADFDWFQTPELIGELTFDIIRGNEVYGFNFDKQWLSNHGDIFLGDDLHYFPGLQYSDSGKDIFSCFSDALPDRWGRTLLKRREQIIAQEEKRPVKRLTSFKNKLKRSASIDVAERFNHISKVLGLMVESLKLSLEFSTFRVKPEV